MDRNKKDSSGLEEKVLLIRRVSKKIPGGNYSTFAALVAVGDRKGRVGVGVGRGLEVPPAINKALNYAKKHMIVVPQKDKTLTHQIKFKYKAAQILLKPAPPGTGLKVGSVTRVLLDLAGVENASGKIIRSRNQIVNTYAVIKALSLLKS